MLNDRECDKCVYHSSGKCSQWSCNGTKTVKDIKNEAIDEFVDFVNTMPTYENEYGEKMPMPIEMMAKQIKR